MAISMRRILALAIPMAGEQFLIFGILLFDTALAGRLGVVEVSTQAVVVLWAQFTSVIFNIMVVGGSILVAQEIGRGNEQESNQLLFATLLLALLSGALLTIIVLLLSPTLISIMGVEDSVRELGIPYLRLIAFSFPLNFMLLSASGCIRGAGEARAPLIVMGIANAVHVVLAVALVFGMGLGLNGLGIATILSRGAGLLLMLLLLARGIAGLRLIRMALPLTAMREVLRVGSAVGGEQLALRLGQLINLRLVATLGTQLLAVYTVVLNSLSIILMVGLGFMMAALTIVGQQVGADKQEYVYSTGWRIIYLAWGIMGGLSLLFFLSPEVNALFSNDEAVLDLAAGGLRVILIGIPFEVINQALTGALRGSGDTRYPMFVTALGHWIVRLPLIALFIGPLRLGLDGVWLAMIVEMLVRSVLNMARFRSGFNLTVLERGARVI